MSGPWRCVRSRPDAESCGPTPWGDLHAASGNRRHRQRLHGPTPPRSASLPLRSPPGRFPKATPLLHATCSACPSALQFSAPENCAASFLEHPVVILENDGVLVCGANVWTPLIGWGPRIDRRNLDQRSPVGDTVAMSGRCHRRVNRGVLEAGLGLRRTNLTGSFKPRPNGDRAERPGVPGALPV